MMQNWWSSFFDESFGQLYLEKDDGKDFRKEMAGLAALLHITAGNDVFDQCCGTGSVSAVLAEDAEVNTMGIDQSAAYISKAQARVAPAQLPCLFETADAFTYVPTAPCDAAINWGTSCGYLADDRENIKMMECLFQSLRSGGYVAIEYSNAASDIKNFKSHVHYVKETPNGPLNVDRHFDLDIVRGMRTSRWIYQNDAGKTYETYGESRLYMPIDIANMLQQCGFTEIVLYANAYGQPLTADSPRFLAIGKRP